MAGFVRTVHPQTAFDFGPVDKFAADLGLRVEGGEPHALAFRDPDGETHVYVFSEEGRQRLIETLAGGILIAPPGSFQ